MNDHETHNIHESDVDYERSDTNLRQIVIVGVIGFVSLIVSFVVIDDYFSIAREEQMHEVVLSVPSPELRELRIAEQESLTKYKLLNADSGRYQIPIERAMQLIAEEAFLKKSGK